jgi:hypothetical protein
MLRRTIRKLAKALFPKEWAKFSGWRALRADRRHWDERIADVLACPDNGRLPRVPDAGTIDDGFQVMHNGLEVVVNGYYGNGLTRMLTANRGCHEPQEEVVFDKIMQSLPAGAVMLEVGAYWGFYSMWFCKAIPEAKVYLVEPDRENLEVGQCNFRRNRCLGDFTRAYVGARPGSYPDGSRIVSIDSLLAEKKLDRLNVLHADVQGCEVDMLHGSHSLFKRRAVDYVFLSTHSMELHAQCIEFLQEYGYRILVSVDLEETHSVDGVLVACSALISPPAFQPLSKKTRRSFRS